MTLYIDADACPKVIKEIVFRAAARAEIDAVFVANQYIPIPPSPYLSMLQVNAGPDVADDEIVARCVPGDLVVTADLPLALRVVEKGVFALDPRGRVYDRENIRQIVSMRDFMDSLRGSGIDTGGPSGFSQKERNLFANELDKFIAKHKKSKSAQ